MSTPIASPRTIIEAVRDGPEDSPRRHTSVCPRWETSPFAMCATTGRSIWSTPHSSTTHVSRFMPKTNSRSLISQSMSCRSRSCFRAPMAEIGSAIRSRPQWKSTRENRVSQQPDRSLDTERAGGLLSDSCQGN